MISTILFDVDGVLVVSEPFSATLAREYGITMEMTAPFFRGPFGQCLIGKADLKAEIASYLPMWGWRGSVDEFLGIWFTSGQQIDDALLTTVQRLRQQGIRCCLATNQERYRTEYLLTRMELAEQFDGCFSSAYIGYLKDHPAFFQTVCAPCPARSLAKSSSGTTPRPTSKRPAPLACAPKSIPPLPISSSGCACTRSA